MTITRQPLHTIRTPPRHHQDARRNTSGQPLHTIRTPDGTPLGTPASNRRTPPGHHQDTRRDTTKTPDGTPTGHQTGHHQDATRNTNGTPDGTPAGHRRPRTPPHTRRSNICLDFALATKGSFLSPAHAASPRPHARTNETKRFPGWRFHKRTHPPTSNVSKTCLDVLTFSKENVRKIIQI